MSLDSLSDRIRKALARNERVQIGGVLLKQRVLVTDCGFVSCDGEPELIALIDNRFQSFWYGHVFRWKPQGETNTEDPLWVSLIVSSDTDLDASTPQRVFRNAYLAFVQNGDYQPGYCREHGELSRMAGSFEEACHNLETMVANFDTLIARGPWFGADARYSDRLPPDQEEGLRLDMSAFPYGMDFPTPAELHRRWRPIPW